MSRIVAYMQKAMREAKVHTAWTAPNEAYEQAVGAFVSRILDETVSDAFLRDFRAFQRRISHFGLLNSLARRCFNSAPGAPDLYQGTALGLQPGGS